MKVILKYIEDTYEGGKYFAPHAFIDGEDKGQVVNERQFNLGDEIPEESEIEIQFMGVCPDCLDESEKDECTCWYHGYKEITVIKSVCKCCGHIL